MTPTTLAWLALIAYALHIMEEFAFDWRDWARGVIHFPVEWSDFYVTNAVVVVLGIAQAELAASLPLIPLSFAALMLINATFFHVLPMILTRGRYSPGVSTAVLLLLSHCHRRVLAGKSRRRKRSHHDRSRGHRRRADGLPRRHAAFERQAVLPADAVAR